MAEGVGFEPTNPSGFPVFKTGAINRSTIPPIGKALNADLWSIDNHISSKACFLQLGKVPKGSHFVQSSSPFLKQLTDKEVLKY